MKRLLSVILVAAIFVTTLGFPVSAAEVNSDKAENANVEPRLNYQVTIQLGSAWTDIWVEQNLAFANLTVKNMTTSSNDVLIRIISIDREDVLKAEQTIQPGYSASYFLPSGGYIIQGKSVDKDAHTYELRCFDQYA